MIFELFSNNYFKEYILMAASAIRFFQLFLLPRKQVRKSVGLLRNSPNALPKTSKLSIRPNHDYGYIIYDQAYIFSFHQKVDSFQYNASLAITCAIRGTSKEKIYQKMVQKYLLLC